MPAENQQAFFISEARSRHPRSLVALPPAAQHPPRCFSMVLDY